MTHRTHLCAKTRGEALGVAFAGLLLALVAWSPAIVHLPATGGGDGQFYQHMLDAGKVSVLYYHELPLWNAFQCGGVPLWDNPQGLVASPIAFALIGVSAAKTLVAWYVVHAATGFFGTWCLARLDLGLGRTASFAAAAMYAFGVAHATQYGGGHTALAPFLFGPLCLYVWRRAEARMDYAVCLGFLYALMFYNGGVYPIPFITVLLASETLTRFWPPRRVALVLKAGAIATLVFVVLSAARLFPVIDQLAHHKRTLDIETDYVHWQTLQDMYLDRAHSWRIDGQSYVWPEYAAYIGILGVALAGVGVAHMQRKDAWVLALALVIFLLMLGHFAPGAPWSFFKHHVFPYTSMRVPTRFRLIGALFPALFIGFAIDRAPRTLARILRRPGSLRQGRVIMSCLALVSVGDVFGTASSIVASKFDGPREWPMVISKRLYVDTESVNFIDQPRQNRARLQCWDEWGFTAGAPLWPGDVPQARPTDARAVVQQVLRTQNTFELDVNVPQDETEILLNSAWDRGWRTSNGRVFERQKQLVLWLPKGHHHVRVYYWPIGLTAGFAVTAVGSFVILLGLVGHWRGRRRRQ